MYDLFQAAAALTSQLIVGCSAGDIYSIDLDNLSDVRDLKPSLCFSSLLLENVMECIVEHLFSVDDGSPVLMVRFVHIGAVLAEPDVEGSLFREEMFAAEGSTYFVLARKLNLCATPGELDSVAAEIKVSLIVHLKILS